MKESLTLLGVRAGYNQKTIIKDISFTVKSGEVLTLLGANGEGKTTLIKTICGLKKTMEGSISINSQLLDRMPQRERASNIAYVPQSHAPGLPLSVLDMVILGRQRCHGLFSYPTKRDEEKAMQSLSLLGIEILAEDIYTQLSGGEQRLVLIARALTQSAGFIILDEPLSNLDLGNQIKVLKVIHNLAKQGKGIIMSSHFPQHSLWINSNTAVLQEGTIKALGPAKEVITSELLSGLYGTKISVIHNREGSSYCEPDFIKEISL